MSTSIERAVSSSFERDADEGIVVDDNDDGSHESQDETDKRSTSATSCGSNMIGDISVFRDFFLAAFSDGYSNMACCGSEGLFPGAAYCNIPGRYTSARVAPIDVNDSAVDGRRIHGSRSNELQLVESCGSHEGSLGSSQRKRPLAVAVGYKYAEDMNGRPIVVTPNRRNAPGRSPSSPKPATASHSVKDFLSPSWFFTDRESDRPRQHVSVKPSSCSDF